ncbi:uncharacterized protein NECHADRAFT_56255, partial [Fusarium vanettenii 77-13-4]
IRINKSNKVIVIFFIYLKLLRYLKLYLKVFILDYTYKTNKYKIPLLNIININTY